MTTPMDASSAGDRVALDVGGVKFTSAITTLTSNSAYFAALLSDTWRDENDGVVNEIFLDQDPDAFRKLLVYMRAGMIEVNNIDTGVLLLAEFLDVERLLIAVKARSYGNLHPGLTETRSYTDDKGAAREFDNKYGGIRKALSNGILLGSLRQEPNLRKEFAIMQLLSDHGSELVSIDMYTDEERDEIVDPDELHNLTIIGALNWLHHHGFAKHEVQLNTECDDVTTMTFSRNNPYSRPNSASTETEIFIPVDKFQSTQLHNWRKDFVMLMADKRDCRFAVEGKASYHPDIDAQDHRDPSETVITEELAWLEKNGFVDREVELENLFRPWIKCALRSYFLCDGIQDKYYHIYSQKIEYLASNRDA